MSLDPTGVVRPISGRFAFKRARMTFGALIMRGQEFESVLAVLMLLPPGSFRRILAVDPAPTGNVSFNVHRVNFYRCIDDTTAL